MRQKTDIATDRNIAYTGNPDQDFAAGMLPHNRYLIDMARVVLANGSDPEVRALATAVIAAQERKSPSGKELNRLNRM